MDPWCGDIPGALPPASWLTPPVFVAHGNSCLLFYVHWRWTQGGGGGRMHSLPRLLSLMCSLPGPLSLVQLLVCGTPGDSPGSEQTGGRLGRADPGLQSCVSFPRLFLGPLSFLRRPQTLPQPMFTDTQSFHLLT